MKIHYEAWAPGPDARLMVRRAEAICEEYAALGYDLTLRQAYYQFVARGWIPNSDKSYNKLGNVINRARLAGMLDWDHIVDRTRNLRKLAHWDNAGALMRSAAASFGMDLWANQPTHVEVWVEKEALAGVVSRAAERYDCAWFACRGYVSQSEQWAAAQRIGGYLRRGQSVVILHLGDHDPSGIDMTRDIEDRLKDFIVTDTANRFDLWDDSGVSYGTVWEHLRMNGAEYPEGSFAPLYVNRIALNMDQIEQYDPPPNPAKLTDSRATSYVDLFGLESWELDALDPTTLDALVTNEIERYMDADLMDGARAEQERIREGVQTLADLPWSVVLDFIADFVDPEQSS